MHRRTSLKGFSSGDAIRGGAPVHHLVSNSFCYVCHHAKSTAQISGDILAIQPPTKVSCAFACSAQEPSAISLGFLERPHLCHPVMALGSKVLGRQ